MSVISETIRAMFPPKSMREAASAVSHSHRACLRCSTPGEIITKLLHAVTCRAIYGYSMIRKSGHRFSEKDHAQTKS
ncbi:hypothetical protein AAFX91_10560 [Bradyrhizobium sp. 31Argb]|uniref:hypothetical protein n=1 Tax=unclassified Bradyrhizobium TaxID=2631580 RepID=UPI0013EE6CEC|nr:hypothetical protein [Bradyrhizobium sp. Arg237L]MDI4235918.1 hypothetical protein [Bradyrhizobium sp. Arg237L]